MVYPYPPASESAIKVAVSIFCSIVFASVFLALVLPMSSASRTSPSRVLSTLTVPPLAAIPEPPPETTQPPPTTTEPPAPPAPSPAPQMPTSGCCGPHSDAWWHGVAICEQGGNNHPYFGYFSFMDGSQGGKPWDEQVAAGNALLAWAGREIGPWAESCIRAGYNASPGG